MIYNNTIVILTKKDFTHIVHQKVFLRNIDTYKVKVLETASVKNCILLHVHIFVHFFCNKSLKFQLNQHQKSRVRRYFNEIHTICFKINCPLQTKKKNKNKIYVYTVMTNGSYLYISTHRCASYIIG